MESQQTQTTKDTLLFIPDISGFTKFVNDTEVQHSQHIIEELLEIIIDSNDIGMTMSDIEGDAVFSTAKALPRQLRRSWRRCKKCSSIFIPI